MFKLHITLICFVYLQFSSAIFIDSVTLSHNKEYLRLQEDNKNILLECKFRLDAGEEVTFVTWYHDDHMAMKWSKTEPPTIGTGVREGDLILTRGDWHIQFANVNLQLAGKYRCEVTTSKATTSKSHSYQLLIIDMPYMDSKLAEYTVKDCKINFSWKAPPVNPRPEPMCGIWSMNNGFISTVPTFSATPYFNGSIGYNLRNETFEISNMPVDSVIRCELKMTKIDRTVIELLKKSYQIPEVSERGCPPIHVEKGIDLVYQNYRLTCRDEIAQEDDTKLAKAEVRCKEGFVPRYPDYVTNVTLKCDKGSWSLDKGQQWNHFDNLLCVLPEQVPPVQIVRKKEKQKMKEEETSSGMQRLMSPWVILLVVSLTIASGVIWSFKVNSRRKDPKYMA